MRRIRKRPAAERDRRLLEQFQKQPRLSGTESTRDLSRKEASLEQDGPGITLFEQGKTEEAFPLLEEEAARE